MFSELKNALEQFIAGSLDAPGLKHVTAPFGIYQQRNDAFMTRIRISGGHLTVNYLKTIAEIMRRHSVGFAHLTTRQDIQLHNVPVENVFLTVANCVDEDLPFRGGGGNTFRNILVNPASGISCDGVFDVMPYAIGLRDVVFACDKAFILPRKLKIGFVDSPRLELCAATQDLGFIAAQDGNRRGFTVFGGGGMGRNSRIGVKLFDFLPVEKLSKCALAMVDMFYDHGDRDNRNRARIRYLVERFGADEFKKLFMEYYQKSSVADNRPVHEELYENSVERLKKSQGAEADSNDAFAQWQQFAVTPTRFGDDVVSVRLFVPGGNLLAGHLEKLAEIVEYTGCDFIRLTAEQDILLPLVHRSCLPELFKLIEREFDDIDLTLKSFKGHIVSCIGASVCKIGILDAPAAADAVADELDAYFADKLELKGRCGRTVIDTVRISGCPNCCAAHPSAPIGLQGQKKKFAADAASEPAYQFFTGAQHCPAGLSCPDGDPVRASEAPVKVLQLVKDYYVGNNE